MKTLRLCAVLVAAMFLSLSMLFVACDPVGDDDDNCVGNACNSTPTPETLTGSIIVEAPLDGVTAILMDEEGEQELDTCSPAQCTMNSVEYGQYLIKGTRENSLFATEELEVASEQALAHTMIGGLAPNADYERGTARCDDPNRIVNDDPRMITSEIRPSGRLNMNLNSMWVIVTGSSFTDTLDWSGEIHEVNGVLKEIYLSRPSTATELWYCIVE